LIFVSLHTFLAPAFSFTWLLFSKDNWLWNAVALFLGVYALVLGGLALFAMFNLLRELP